MKKVAFVTYNRSPDMMADDRLVADYLQEKTVQVQGAAWDDASIQWGNFDAVILRSCWNYHRQLPEFLAWLSRMAAKIPCWNMPDIVRWNAHKTYLRELQNQGISVAPSLWLNKGEAVDLSNIMATHDWQKVVIKPTVGASAEGAFVVEKAQTDIKQSLLDKALAHQDMMIQAFVEEIQTEGELSLVFFDRKYSHTVLKRPQKGDYRVQHEYSGTIEYVTPKSALIKQAQQVIVAVNKPLLYTRVDGVNVNGKLMLMELELIEPGLFLHEKAAAQFGNAILRWLKQA